MNLEAYKYALKKAGSSWEEFYQTAQSVDPKGFATATRYGYSAYTISAAFCWGDSLQGHDYWKGVKTEMSNQPTKYSYCEHSWVGSGNPGGLVWCKLCDVEYNPKMHFGIVNSGE